jgi:prepilin-type N-terminal cleavage/methylation domain-containing protein
MRRTQHQRNSGFTIIEVLIVLAIAGLILLIVFLAVPALQRNSRNTQRKNDVAAALGGLSTYLNDNNGTIPATCDSSVATCWMNSALGVKLGFYDTTTAGNATWTKQAAATVAPNVPTASATSTVKIYNNAKCLDASTTSTQATATSTTTGASSRSIVAMYAIEGGTGGITYVCQEG